MISNLPPYTASKASFHPSLQSTLTFRRIPRAPEESARSLPARSTKLILLTWGWRKEAGCGLGWVGVGRGLGEEPAEIWVFRKG